MAKVTNIANSLKLHQQVVQVIQDDLGNVGDPNATSTDATISVGLHGNKLNVSKNKDFFAFQTRLNNFSKAAHSETISNVLAGYTSILQGKEATDSNLLNAIDEFEAGMTSLSLHREGVSRQSVLAKAENLANSFNEKLDGIKSLRSLSHNQYLEELTNVNSYCRQLYELNQEMSRVSNTRGNAFRLEAKRNELAINIARTFNVRVREGQNGIALVTSADGAVELVGRSGYAKFTPQGNFNQAFGEESLPADLSVDMETVRADGAITNRSTVFKGDGSVRRIYGGTFEAYVELRDNVLKDAVDAVSSVASEVTQKINEIHNDGTPWPPKTRYEASNLFAPNTQLDFDGVLSVFALDSNGRQLKGGAGNVHQMNLDFSKLRNERGVGNPTLREVANELNYMLSSGQAERRAALGELNIPQPGNANTAYSTSEYLLNNIKLVGAADIEGNQYTFDLELDGNSYFGTTVEILEIETTGNIPLPAAQLPPAFKLERDTITQTGNTITVPTTGIVNDTIGLNIRVTGSNGVVREGQIEFVLDSTNPSQLNKRIAFDGDALKINNFVSPSSHSGLASVKLVDAEGTIIADDDFATPARMVIETSTNDYRVALQDSNFSFLLGMNNLFEHNEDGTFQVNQDILEDPANFTGGRVSKGAISTVAKVGDAKANVQFDFANAPANNFQALDTITIDGVTINIVAGAPANENEVQVNAGGFDATKADIVAAINNHSVLSKKFLAIDSVGGTDFKVEVLEPGTWANNAPPFPGIQVNATLVGGGLQVSVNGAGPALIQNGNFVGGTDKDEALTIFDYTIGNRATEVFKKIADLNVRVLEFEGSGEIHGYTGTIAGYASELVSVISAQANRASTESEIRSNVLDESDEDFKSRFGIDPRAKYFNLVDVGQTLKILSAALAENFKILKSVQDTIAAA